MTRETSSDHGHPSDHATAQQQGRQKAAPIDSAKQPAKGLSRRSLLVGGGIGIGLIVGWGLWPRHYAINLQAAEGEHVFSSWIKIAEDGKIIVAIPQSEVGQGSYSLLAQIIAGELGADWRTVAVQPAQTSPIFANQLLAKKWAPVIVPDGWDVDILGSWGHSSIEEVASRSTFMVTAGSSSQRQFEPIARHAAAAARMLLCQAAAKRWDIGWENCHAVSGFVRYDSKEIAFSELAAEASKQVGENQLNPDGLEGIVSPRPIQDDLLYGKELPRLDLPAKVDGSINFAGDIRLPDMVYASVRTGPHGNSRLKSINRDGASRVRDLIDVVSTDKWVAAIASNWWAANNALDAIAPTYETRGILPDSDSIDEALSAAFDGTGWEIRAEGSINESFKKSSGTRIIKGEYRSSPAVHAAIETRTATAQLRNGRLQLWMNTQAPENARAMAAKAIDISVNDVILYPMFGGGSFGRNMDNQIASQAAILAQHMSKPVQVIWSRPEDFMRDHVRAPAKARMSAAINIAGRLSGFKASVAIPPTMREQMLRLRGDDEITAIQKSADIYDPLATEGFDPPYAIPNISINQYPAKIDIPTGRWRGNGHVFSCFCIESFVDELAYAASIEPLSYRMQMLVRQTRLARCLTTVANMAGWDGGAEGSGKGLACHSMRGSHIAVIAEAQSGDQGIRVKRISAVVDCGQIVNPAIARAQIEGGIIFGLAQAVGSSVGFRGGMPTARRLRDVNLPALADVPEIQVEFIRSSEESGGIGELGVPAVSPAIGNALFSASNVRLRELPLLSLGL